MGEVVRDVIESWQDGVITAGESDQIPPSAVPLAYNSILVSMGPGKAIFAKRDGFETMSATPMTGSSPIIGMFGFRERSGATYTPQHLLISQAGEIASMSTIGVMTTLSLTGFTSGIHYPAFSVMNNLCFICNGVEVKKVTGGVLRNWGITRPTVGTLAGAAGAAGSPNGTYELRVTYGNSSTGNESSSSETATATAVVVNQKISVTNVPVSSDAQVDRRYLYVRNTATQTAFYRAGTISDNTATTITLDFVDANLTIVAPGQGANDPPPATIIASAVHNNRMFVATATSLYYSNSGQPEQFNLVSQYEDVSKDDGQIITGIKSIGGMLLITKEQSTYVLEGVTPSTWAFRLIDGKIGNATQRALITAGGRAYWWSESHGPVSWGPDAQVLPIGLGLIDDTIASDVLNTAEVGNICAVADEGQQRVLFAVAEVGKTRNTVLLPFSTRLMRWEASRWDPFDVSSLSIAEDATQVRRLHIGGYSGQLWKYGADGRDGVISGTHTGTFVATNSSISSITDLTAAFNTTGGGLVERKVSILDADYTMMTITRPYISANTATALTLSTSVSGLVIGATYTYIVGGADFQVESYTRSLGSPFHKKRFEFGYLATRPQGSAVLVTLAVNTQDELLSHVHNATAGASWDDATWDESYWSSSTNIYSKFRIARTGVSFSMRVRNPYVDQGLAVIKMGSRAELQVERWD